ncbi:MAG: flagellar hook protein FlgE [Campylobacterota bacterium]|nr:flagellar hook protein FlgE [Campylobacterota bacterium]
MLKSLYSGISGLQSHQVGMDVESNNIANVNTTGFKYSRANFSDLLAQTKSIATAPQGSLGGKNAVQIGLGSSVTSTTTIFSQGSIQSTDKNTDVAIQGDGFFISSPDSGNTYKYTRAGDFKFDAAGNFVDNNGYLIQGWVKDDEMGVVDTTAPITNIKIAPGLTTPAAPTTEVVLKANLNSGSEVVSYSPAYTVASGAAAANPLIQAVDGDGFPIASGDLGAMFNAEGEGFALQKDQGVWVSFLSSTKTDGGAVASGDAELDVTFTLDDGTTKQITTTGGDAGNSESDNAFRYVSAINAQTSTTGVTASYDRVNNKIDLSNTNGSSSQSHNINIAAGGANSGLSAGTQTVTTAYKYQYDPSGAIAIADSDKTFRTIAQLREALEVQANALDVDGDGVINESNIEISVNAQGKIEIANPGGGDDSYDMNIKVSSITGAGITENVRFTNNMDALSSIIPVGNSKAYSQSFNAATHSSSIDVFDSLGSKHTVKMDFRKTIVDTETGSTWEMHVTVPNPATIDTVEPFNSKSGQVRFNNDGSIAGYSPPNISFSANNGSAPNQQVSLSFGNTSGFNGMTSFDSNSATSGISQDGFTGGDLIDIRIDQTGTVVGSFSNGHSFGLAQVAMAKFTNNEGLSTEGGNVYVQTANSGDPIIGTAATSGRGFIQSSSLESSNVDLSRSLTQLIIVQRGYQANGKVITTSDTLLETLIGLKR